MSYYFYLSAILRMNCFKMYHLLLSIKLEYFIVKWVALDE